jgi:hypothetical protein
VRRKAHPLPAGQCNMDIHDATPIAWTLVDRRTLVFLWMGSVVLTISVIMIGVGDGFARRG